jgi:hypothetical protein
MVVIVVSEYIESIELMLVLVKLLLEAFESAPARVL